MSEFPVTDARGDFDRFAKYVWLNPRLARCDVQYLRVATVR